MTVKVVLWILHFVDYQNFWETLPQMLDGYAVDMITYLDLTAPVRALCS
jgi:hypothetical protein